MNILGYIRVSNEDQIENYSLHNQLEYIKGFCDSNGHKLIKTFSDEGKSASNTNRKELIKLLDYALNDRNSIDAIAVYKIDRLSRETGDYLNIKAKLLNKDILIISVTEPIDATPQGEFLETIMAAQAKLDNAIKSQRTIDGMTRRLESGLPTNPPPVGYVYESKVEGKNNVVRDEPRFSLLKKAGKKYMQGSHTSTEIADFLDEEGFRTRGGLKPNSKFFNSFVKNKFYAGYIFSKTRNKEFEGSYERMFTLEEWLKMQEIASGRVKISFTRHHNNPDFPLRRFLKCGQCGQKLTGAWSKGRNKRYAYYFCPNHSPSIKKDELETEFISVLEKLTPKKEVADEFALILNKKYVEYLKNCGVNKEKVQKKITKLKEKQNMIVEKNIKGVYSDNISKEQLTQVKKEVDRLSTKLHDINNNQLKPDEISSFAHDFLTNLRTTWETSSLEEKQRLQTIIFPDGVFYEFPGIRTTTLSPIFNVLKMYEEGNSNLGWLIGFEPTTFASTGRRSTTELQPPRHYHATQNLWIIPLLYATKGLELNYILT